MTEKDPNKKTPMSKKDKILAGVAISLLILILGLFVFDVRPKETATSEDATAEEEVIESESVAESVIVEEEIASEPVQEVYTAEQQVLVDELTQRFELSLGIEMSELTILDEGFTDEIVATVITTYSYGAAYKEYTTLYNPYYQSINDVIEDTVPNFHSSREYTYMDYSFGESYYMVYDYMGHEHTAYSIPESDVYPSSFRIDDLADEEYLNNMLR